MSDVPVGLVMPQTASMPRVPTADDVSEFGRTVESLGYDSLWLNESWGCDTFIELAAAARHTDELRLGTSIVNVFTRTPATLAMAAASMARTSDDRFVLGLGASHPELVEDLHNVDWDRPVHRMFETISLLRELLGDGEELDYESDLFDVSGFPPLSADVPIYSAALGPANRRVTGRVSDGWIPYNVPFDDLDNAFETVAGAASEAGRDPDDVAVVPYVAAVVDDDPEAAREEIRTNIASYVGGFADDSYKNAVGEGFADQADHIADAWRRGDESAARVAVTDEMVDAIGIAGTPEMAREKLRSVRDRPLVDEVLVAVPHPVDREMADRTVRELAPSEL
ncbi:LLM class flavin-dependent oxidoreductase [Natronosalvus halobius]|uniref:LLM class flavin-dependent oxidoreductase n=1 Tax=Natronosalvus halobius TaxID=2953746 RepID=UPI00209E1549|nr:LLM class flavin-dependent oxidoreductase [Natronosalvus halobius]USZ73598.1 LLM class flavin-dependent oxidoreductase [Natronosalvus halobius]